MTRQDSQDSQDRQEKIINALMLSYMADTAEGKALRSALKRAFLYGWEEGRKP